VGRLVAWGLFCSYVGGGAWLLWMTSVQVPGRRPCGARRLRDQGGAPSSNSGQLTDASAALEGRFSPDDAHLVSDVSKPGSTAEPSSKGD